MSIFLTMREIGKFLFETRLESEPYERNAGHSMTDVPFAAPLPPN